MIYSFLRGFALHIIIGSVAFLIAVRFVDGVYGDTQSVIIAGVVLGFMNFLIRPVLKIITLPLRILTLGLFTFIINIAIVWFVKALFPELVIDGIAALLYTTVIVWAIEFVFYSTFS